MKVDANLRRDHLRSRGIDSVGNFSKSKWLNLTLRLLGLESDKTHANFRMRSQTCFFEWACSPFLEGSDLKPVPFRMHTSIIY